MLVVDEDRVVGKFGIMFGLKGLGILYIFVVQQVEVVQCIQVFIVVEMDVEVWQDVVNIIIKCELCVGSSIIDGISQYDFLFVWVNEGEVQVVKFWNFVLENQVYICNCIVVCDVNS